MERFLEWVKPINRRKRSADDIAYHKNIYVYNLIFTNNTDEFVRIVHESGGIFVWAQGITDMDVYLHSLYEACGNKNRIITEMLYHRITEINNVTMNNMLLRYFIRNDDATALDFLFKLFPNIYVIYYNKRDLYNKPKIYEYLYHTYIKDEAFDIIGKPDWRDEIFYSHELFIYHNLIYRDISFLDDFVNIGYPKRFDIDEDKNIGVVLIRLLYGPNNEFDEMDFEGDADIGENITWENVVLMFGKDYAAIVRYVYTKISDHFRHMGVVPFVPYPAVMRLLSSVDTIQQSYRTGVKTD